MNEQSRLRWVFRHRGALITPPLIFALFCLWDEIEDPELFWPLGIALVLTGLALRIWAQEHLRHRLRIPMQLTTSGPYQFVRNPLYLGNTLIYLGATITSELLWMVPVTLLWCLGIYSRVVRYEETALLEQYGEAYREYLRGVPRCLPRGLRFQRWDFLNQHFGAAVAAEAHCLLIVLPYVVKEVVAHYLVR